MPASVSPRISKEDVLELPVVDLEMDPVLVGFIITSARIWRVGIRAVIIWSWAVRIWSWAVRIWSWAVRIWSWAVRIWRVSSTTAFLVIELPVVHLENLPEMVPVLVGFIITSARMWRVGIRAAIIWSWAVRIWNVSSTTAFL